MPDEPTYCEDCDLVQEQTRKEAPYRWLCTASPRETYPAYTKRGTITGEPFYRCQLQNQLGACPMFTPRRKKEAPDAQ